MSRDKRYQRLLNSRRWSEVKALVWHRAGGLCEQCKADGYIKQGVDCHHILPVEGGSTLHEMEARCYNPDNVRLLCVPCHIKAHQHMNSHHRDQVMANRQRRLDRWVERLAEQFRHKDID